MLLLMRDPNSNGDLCSRLVRCKCQVKPPQPENGKKHKKKRKKHPQKMQPFFICIFEMGCKASPTRQLFLQMQRLLLGRLCVRCTGRSLRLRGVRHGRGGAYVARPGGGIHLAVSLLAIRTGTTEQPELQPAPGHPLAPGISQVDAPMVC